MKNIKYIISALICLSLLSSCEDNLETKVDSIYGDEFTYSNGNIAEGLLMNAYISISDQLDSYNNNFLDAATDNALTINDGSNMDDLGAGRMSSSDNPISNWSTAYSCFAYINLFMEKCLDPEQVIYNITNEVIDEAERKRLTGEGYFLRAFWGMELLKRYGGITNSGEALGYPIITDFVANDNQDSLLNLPRDTYEDCVQQILKDCDSAILYLPLRYEFSDLTVGESEMGRASGKAAYVLKSRAAVFGASAAYQPVSISDDSIKSKWKRATLLCEEAITEGKLPSYTAFAYEDVVNPTLKSTPADYIFRTYHSNRSIEIRNLPHSFLGNGYTNPSQNLVNAFPMENGYPINHSMSGYNSQNPYINRDARLKATVIYNGASVEDGGRALEISDSVYLRCIIDIERFVTDSVVFGDNIFYYYDYDTTFQDYSRMGYESPISEYRATRTGYYLRKWVSNKANMLTLGAEKTQQHMNPILRVAEVYHNYAEASYEAVGALATVEGCRYSAKDVLSQIRTETLGLSTDPYLDEASANDELFRELLYNERRIEFAFENHRYFNMRRCNMPLDEPVYGIIVEQDINGAGIYDSDDIDNANLVSSPTYTYYGTSADGSDAITVEERVYTSEKYYYCPLPYSELVKNPYLTNNKGW